MCRNKIKHIDLECYLERCFRARFWPNRRRVRRGRAAAPPDFRFKNLTYFIQTSDKVAAEYQVEALVLDTGKIYRQTYAGVLFAENGKIKLLHETLDTLAASQAFSKD